MGLTSGSVRSGPAGLHRRQRDLGLQGRSRPSRHLPHPHAGQPSWHCPSTLSPFSPAADLTLPAEPPTSPAGRGRLCPLLTLRQELGRVGRSMTRRKRGEGREDGGHGGGGGDLEKLWQGHNHCEHRPPPLNSTWGTGTWVEGEKAMGEEGEEGDTGPGKGRGEKKGEQREKLTSPSPAIFIPTFTLPVPSSSFPLPAQGAQPGPRPTHERPYLGSSGFHSAGLKPWLYPALAV